jgi:4-hydroxy-3-polyprenylbenzoate decarboxylase
VLAQGHQRAQHQRSRLPPRANTGPQRDSLPKPRRRQESIFNKGPADVLDHATSEMASDSKLGSEATKRIPGEGFKRPWPPLINMDAAVRNGINSLFAKEQ